jgi:sialate O-acetylesterase
MKRYFVILILASIWSQSVMAEVTLNGIFTDNMVLQHGTGTPVFGLADPGEKVTVQVAGQKADAMADKDGKWIARLDLGKAGGPFELAVSASGKTLKLVNVMIGEVWLCSGQSNMQFGLKDALEGPAAITSANLPNLRMIIGKNWTTGAKANRWIACDPTNAAQFSAVAFFFGRDLSQTLQVPVGLVINGIGGTPIEAWTSKDGIAADPELRKLVLGAYDQNIAAYPKAMADYEAAPKDKKPPKPVEPNADQHPGYLFFQHLAPFTGFGMKGVIWYQGESDAWGLSLAQLYYRALPVMINDWRNHFGKDLAFVVIQLPDNPDVKSPAHPKQVFPWKLVQEAQLQAAKIPGVGLAITLDLGENDIHPKKKEAVGKRTALVARSLAYGEKLDSTGPLYDSAKVEDGKIRVSFKPSGGGLEVKGGGELKGFTIASDDRHFIWAKARIEGDQVVVWSEDIPKPAAVRYCFTEGGEFNLYGKNGIPASPFRTDDWSWDTPAKAARNAVAVRMIGPKPLTPADQSSFTIAHSYRPAANATEAAFSYDDNNLFVSIRCAQATAMSPMGEKTDDDKILQGDFVDVLVDPKLDKRNYIRITVNPKGLMLDATCFNDAVEGPKWLRGDLLASQRGMDKTWESGAKIETGEGGGAWTAVMTIPWKSIGVEPKAGLKMGLQMERYVAADEENSEWITAGRDRNTGAMMPWPKLFHSPMRFGTLTLD